MLQIQQKPGSVLDFVAVREVEGNTLCLSTDKKGEREYKTVIEATPVNFSLMSEGEQETILEGFRVFLARLSFPLMVHVRVEPYELSTYLQQLERVGERPDASPVIKEMAADHIAFVHSLAASRAILQRKFYLIVPADKQSKQKGKTQAELADLAKSQLDLRCGDIIADLERMGLVARRLGKMELVHYYQSCLHAQAARAFPLSEQAVEAAARPLRPKRREKAIARSAATSATEASLKTQTQKPDAEYPDVIKLAELLAPSSLDIRFSYARLHHQDLNEYIRSYAIIGYPSQVSAGWLDRLIQIEEPYVEIAMHIQPIDAGAHIQRLTRKLTGYRATQMLEERRGRDHDPWINSARREVETLREKLVEQEEQVFGVSLYLLVRASSRLQLNERSSRLLSLLKSLELTPVSLTMEHQRGLLCLLPDGRDVLKRRKILDTSSLITAFPFASSSLSMEKGILAGVMPNGSLVVMDPASDQLENGHEIKFARSGAGKSYDEKVRIARSLLLGYECIVIDPEDEYRRMCRKFGGLNIRLSDGALMLNPLDLPSSADSSERNVLEEKFQSLLALCDLLLADRGPNMPGTLSQKEKGYLSKCFARVYADAGITPDLATYSNPAPSMADLYDVIRSGVCGPDSFELGDRLQRYIPAFPTETSIRLENPFVVFNIRDLNADLRPVGLFLITDFVWTQVRTKRHPVPRLLVIDEAWSLLQFVEGGRFLASISRRARKYNLCLRTITQDVEDFLGSEWGRTILVNSSMKFLMKQDSTTIDAIARAFKLSDGERKYLLSCAKGEGLFFARGSHVPMKVVASPLEHKLATTNPRELLEEELAEAAAAREQEQAAQEVTALAIPTREANHYDVVLPSFWERRKDEVA